MSRLPLASVVIDNYNYGRFLAGAIDSALGQTYPRTEVVVVDDGSTDDSRRVIASYGGRVVPVLKANGGQGSAFNAGFAACRGDVVLFLDADDLLLPTALERAAPLLDDPAVVKVHWPLREVDEGLRDTGRLVPPTALAEGDLRDVLLRTSPVNYAWAPTSGNAWARRFLAAVLPVPEAEYRVSADLYLAALAPFYGHVRSVHEPQGLFRLHGENRFQRMPFEEKVAVSAGQAEHCFALVERHCRALGVVGDADTWRAHSWWHKLRRVLEDLAGLLPRGDTVIVADEDHWQMDATLLGCRRLPFLERDGVYWGPAPDDATAVAELERLRGDGAGFVVFGWPAFWWLDHYRGLRQHLDRHYHRLLQDERVVVFALRGSAP
jgi:glycosyltransferase involved in cell wall biosynthesis